MPQVDLVDLNQAYHTLEQAGREQMLKEGVASQQIEFFRTADMRYLGQGYELAVTVPGGELGPSQLETVKKRFHTNHQQAYGYANWDDVTEFVTLRVVAIGQLSKPTFHAQEPGPDATTNPKGAQKGERSVYLKGDWVQALIFERSRLRAGDRVLGPAVIEQLDSTTVISPRQQATVDRHLNLVVERVDG
jgi:N-methylhydantoinase A